MFLYYYFMAGQMEGEGHVASDDCAVCRAWTKNGAVRKFRKLYTDAAETNVFRVRYNRLGIAVLTDF